MSYENSSLVQKACASSYLEETIVSQKESHDFTTRKTMVNMDPLPSMQSIIYEPKNFTNA